MIKKIINWFKSEHEDSKLVIPGQVAMYCQKCAEKWIVTLGYYGKPVDCPVNGCDGKGIPDCRPSICGDFTRLFEVKKREPDVLISNCGICGETHELDHEHITGKALKGAEMSEESLKPELLPCPFCECEFIIFEIGELDLECLGCNTIFCPAGNTLAEVIKKFNTRPNQRRSKQ